MAPLKRPSPRLYWGAPLTLWKQVAQASPDATFFHHPEWAQVLAQTYGYGIHAAYLEFAHGRKALLPIWTRPIYKGMLMAAASGYEGGYGGFISTAPLAPDEIAEAFHLIGQRFPDLAVLSNPFASQPHLPPASEAFEWHPLPATRVLPLGPLEQLRQGYNRERQRASRRWREAGVTTEIIDQPDPALVNVFYPIFEAATHQWEAPWRRPKAFFENLFQWASPWISLNLAKLQGEVVGAEIMAICPPAAFGLMLTWDRAFDGARVATALTETSLAHCHDKGCLWWDFGSSGERDALNRFKETFGGQAWPLFEVRREAWIIKAIQAIRSPYRQLSRPAP